MNLEINSNYSKNVYSPKILRTVRIIALITFSLLIYTTISSLPEEIRTIKDHPEHIVTISIICSKLVNLLTIIFAAIILFYPHKFILIGIGSLLQSISIGAFGHYSYMSLLMLGVAMGTFLVRMGPKLNKKRMAILFGAIYLFELIFPLIYDDLIYLRFLIEKIGGTLTLSICVFFFYQHAKIQNTNNTENAKVLNIAQFKSLDRSDMYLLQDVLDNKKYKEIAQKIHGSEGALRNKLSKIYKILEVGDRTGFITIYSGYQLVYEPEKTVTD